MLARLGIAHLSLLIALMSGGMAIYQGYLGTRNLEIVQRDIGRREQLRACKDVIEAYFDATLRIRRLADVARADDVGASERRALRADAEHAVARFSAIATYLANMEGDAARGRYTDLARALQAAASAATTGTAPDADGVERRFAALNEDCVRSGRVSAWSRPVIRFGSIDIAEEFLWAYS